MRVQFRTPKLARCLRDEAYAAERWGPAAASRYAYVVNFLTCIDTAGDLGRFAFLAAKVENEGGESRWLLPLADDWQLALALVDGDHAVSVVEVTAGHDQ